MPQGGVLPARAGDRRAQVHPLHALVGDVEHGDGALAVVDGHTADLPSLAVALEQRVATGRDEDLLRPARVLAHHRVARRRPGYAR